MNKIITALLGLMFPGISVENLMEIINVTPNPEIATQILCGLYVEPYYAAYSRLGHTDKDNNHVICELLSYNKWDNYVSYEYQQDEIIVLYLPKDLDKSLVTLDNYKDYKVSWSKDVQSLRLFTGITAMQKGTTDLENWNKGMVEV
jgi:hypothetical protein